MGLLLLEVYSTLAALLPVGNETPLYGL